METRTVQTHVAPMTDERYLPLKALSTDAGLSVRTLRSHLSDPVHPLPFYQVGVKILVKRSEFDEWPRQFRVARVGDTINALVDDIVGGMR